MDRLNETTYNIEVKSNPSDRIVVEVGDVLQPDFKPQVKIKRWDNEVNFSMRAEEHPEATVEEVDGVIKYITPKYEVHQYEKPEAGEDGGFEFEWILNEIPESNVLTTTIQSKGLDFFYQPVLTQQEINSGISRPENVIGSYAVYHSTNRNNKVGGMEYKTGKAFHIYRPEAVDVNGVRTWCELNIENGNLTVTIPWEFLDTAVYPVIVDPTFGYTSIGVSTSTNLSNCVALSVGIPVGSGDVTKVSIYARSSSGTDNIKGVIFDKTSIDTATLLSNGVGSAVSVSSLGWYDSSLSPSASVVISEDYFAGSIADTNDIVYYLDIGSSGDGGFATSNSYTTPANITDISFDTAVYSIYATYTASSSFVASPMMHMMAQSGGLI